MNIHPIPNDACQQISCSETVWLTSKEAKKKLHVSDCHLMHIRTAGRLVFMKKGNAFLYDLASIENYLAAKPAEGEA